MHIFFPITNIIKIPVLASISLYNSFHAKEVSLSEYIPLDMSLESTVE